MLYIQPEHQQEHHPGNLEGRARDQVTHNGGVIRTNQKGNYSGFLGYIDTWFHTNSLGNILSLSKVEKLFVITYYHKEKTFVVHTKGEEN